jgi:hypothetical protein
VASVVIFPPLLLPLLLPLPDDELDAPDEEPDPPEDEPEEEEEPPELLLDPSPPPASGLPCPPLLLLHAPASKRRSDEDSPRKHGVRLM